MQAQRTMIRSDRHLVLALLVLTLGLKALVPAGLMLKPGAATLVEVSICTGNAVGDQRIAVALPPDKDGAGHPSGAAAKIGECVWSSLAMPTLAGDVGDVFANVLLLALLLGAAALLAAPVQRRRQWRPPLRGPPRTV